MVVCLSVRRLRRRPMLHKLSENHQFILQLFCNDLDSDSIQRVGDVASRDGKSALSYRPETDRSRHSSTRVHTGVFKNTKTGACLSASD